MRDNKVFCKITVISLIDKIYCDLFIKLNKVNNLNFKKKPELMA